MSKTDELRKRHAQVVAEIERWLQNGKVGLAQIEAYVRVKQPSPSLAWVIYEAVADLRADPSASSRDIEMLLSTIRIFLPAERATK